MHGDELFAAINVFVLQPAARSLIPCEIDDVASDLASVQYLVDPTISHNAAGSLFIREVFSQACLQRLEELRCSLPLDIPWGDELRPLSSGRTRGIIKKRYYNESSTEQDAWVQTAFSHAIQAVLGRSVVVLPKFRFLEYKEDEGMATHTDGQVQHPVTLRKGTHTFLFYLTSCAAGGETAIFDSMKPDAPELARVRPERNAMLLFPGCAPHQGCRMAAREPKIVLRGDLYFD
mmetsp:Transcript_73597/g.116182  ORF Transcript_73597/g.116182 Transcript_73597/m.116182 type:complete len:233 (-) Transcript_73597:142-840(-)